MALRNDAGCNATVRCLRAMDTLSLPRAISACSRSTSPACGTT
jgi:hypothetical protein